MRPIAIALLALMVAAPALAQGWREYVYPNDAFAIHFPADPTIATGTYPSPDGSAVPARIYSLADDAAIYRVRIADFSRSRLDEQAVMSHAFNLIAQQGEVKVDLPARVSRVFGRQMSVGTPDGSHMSVALFYYRSRLYEIVGTALPAAARSGASEAVRFQQSLRFTNDATRLFGFGTQFGANGRF